MFKCRRWVKEGEMAPQIQPLTLTPPPPKSSVSSVMVATAARKTRTLSLGMFIPSGFRAAGPVLFTYWCLSDLHSDFERKNWMMRNLRWITSKPNKCIIFYDWNYYSVSDYFLKSRGSSEANLFLNLNFGFSLDTIEDINIRSFREIYLLELIAFTLK